MSRLKLLGRVQQARQRLRDAQAGISQIAEIARVRAEEAQRETEEEGARALQHRLDTLERGVGVAELFRLEEEWRLQKLAEEEARDQVATRTREAEAARSELQRRERQLRTIESVRERVREEVAAEAAKVEQAQSDDLAAAKVARGEQP
jgi:hypothetical protein